MAGKKKVKKGPAKRAAAQPAKRRRAQPAKPREARPAKHTRTTKTRGGAAARPEPAPRIGVRAQPLIAVRDVISSSRFYRTLLDGHGLDHGSDHDDVYDRVYVGEALVLQLHSWDEEEHPNLQSSEAAPPGHGVLLWFEVTEFDAALERVRALEAEVLQEPHVNEAARHREIWLRDPDGYVVVLASPDGEDA
jgi:Glyoxalase/Bleomycin resistance protein/Dioxygenase superfamily